ncbi:restriction endonuclease subunit S, partial [Methanobrevibacter curvatus]|uniref:restriction endonuclease subunit S n=1 Tax=Methanobrevibacter curvatus TaxID=49547 RepID=UPI000B16850A
KLRFPEFSDEWEEKKLGDLFEIKNGLNKSKDFFGHGIKILNYMDVNKNIFNNENSIKGLVDVNNDEISRYNVKPNDLFFTRTSETSDEIGLSSAYIGKHINCVFSGFILRARGKIKDINALFYAYYFRNPKNRQKIIKHSSITTRALISGSNLSLMKINFTSMNEQFKIADFLTTLDRKVNLLEKKLDIFKDFKKF